MEHKYGEFSENQIHEVKDSLRGKIYFLLLIVDPKTCGEYSSINVNKAFENIMFRIGGLNSLLNEPVEIVTVLSLIESAYKLYNSSSFSFEVYRKLILDAGSEVLKIREGE